jgi:hypothetical protein
METYNKNLEELMKRVDKYNNDDDDMDYIYKDIS